MKHSHNHMPTLNYLLLLFALLATTTLSNLIISASTTSYTVGKTSSITVNIYTSTPISTLDIYIANAFTITANPACSINSTTRSCTKIVPSTGEQVIIRYSSLALIASKGYTVVFAATNPLYSDNFLVRAANSGGSTPVMFNSNGQISIIHNQIACSMTSSSPIVGKSVTATFSLGLQSLPSGTVGTITLSTPFQTVFPNIFNTGPSCIIENNTFGCSLSQIFGQQTLTINSATVGKKTDSSSLIIKITSLKNPPFNSTFENITVEILDQYGRGVQICKILQPKPTELQPSTNFSLSGWASSVGAASNSVQMSLTPFFEPLSDLKILLIFPSQLMITPKSPATISEYVPIDAAAGMTYLLISNASYQDQILKLNASISNPISKIPLTITSYILFNDTHFRETKVLDPALILVPEIITVGSSVLNPQTLVQTRMNVSLTSPISLSKSIVIKAQIQYGDFYCTAISILSNLGTPSVKNCTTKILYLSINSAVITLNTPYWIQVAYITQTAVIDNSISVSVMDEKLYSIMDGQTTMKVSQSTSIFVITNANSTFTASTSFTIVESNVTVLSTIIKRIVQISPPAYVALSSSTAVTSNDGNCIVGSYEIDVGNNKVIATISGKVSVKLSNMLNPTYYDFSRIWQITATDVNSNPSSDSTATHTPQFSPTISKISVQQHSNSTIQQENNITLKIEPLLEYDLADPPTITVQFSGATILNIDQNVCPQCVLLTSTKFQFPAYAVTMYPVVLVENNDDPTSNSVSFKIVWNGFLYESGDVSYELEPIAYSFFANFNGLYQGIGTITINLTSNLGKTVQVTYSGHQAVFPVDSSCQNCNSTFLSIIGITGFFKTATIVVEGSYDGVLYARGIVPVSYTCATISGCQICEQTQEGNQSILNCSKCFSEELSKNYILFENQCYTVCPVKTYQNGVICSSCPSLCYKCSPSLEIQSGILCEQCETPYSLYEQTCVEECPPGFIKNATHCLPRPVICPKNCVDCPQDNVCNKCDAGYYLLENLCYTQCPEGYLISNNNEGECQLFVPPEETDYFPFAFLIASIIALLVFIIIRCFEKRSLIVGNYIAVTAFLEMGPIIMMLVYTFTSINQEPDRWMSEEILVTQALLFVAILTKFILNMAFLAYFLVKIAPQENFQSYIRQKHKRTLYIILLVFSSIFSFQIIRLLYSRLLGLQIFFGRFNTALIFKPLNFFSLAYLVPSGCFIAMSVTNIIMQDGYKTTIFYSSMEVILVQIILLIGCLFQACKADPQYFDYQVYKIGNSFQDDETPNKIDISYQKEDGGSMARINQDADEVMGSARSNYNYHKLGSGVYESSFWRQKTLRPAISEGDEPQQFEIQEDEGEQQQNKALEIQDIDSPYLSPRYKSPENNRSIFRKKIIKQWEAINKNMHNKPISIFKKKNTRPPPKKSNSSIKNKLINQLKREEELQLNKKPTRTSSLTKIQIRSPIFSSIANRSQLKQHFYRIVEKEGESSDKGSIKIAKQSQEGTINNQIFEEVSEANTIAENNYEFDQRSKGDNEQMMVANEYQYQNKIGSNQISQIKGENSQESLQKSLLLGLRTNFKLNRYDEYDQFEADNIIETEDRYEMDTPMRNNRNPDQRASEFIPKRKRFKGKHVNRQTEAVYLQRLMSSEAPRKTTKSKKLDDF